jgi:hypothetical protein
MSSRYRLHSSSASGRGGTQSDELVAELTSALSLEEFKLGGGGKDVSFLMVSEGAGGCCTPLGVVSGESSSSRWLPPHVLARAGRGVLGGGGAIWIAGLALALAWVEGETHLVQHQRAQDKQEHPLVHSGRSRQREEAARCSVARLLKI